MANYITDIYSNKISCRGLQVRPNRDTLKIVTRMLDGQYSVQQIGTQATTLAITLSVQDKTALDKICSTCEPIMIYHFDKIYTGIITSPSIIWTPALVMDLWYQGMFELAVSEVASR